MKGGSHQLLLVLALRKAKSKPIKHQTEDLRSFKGTKFFKASIKVTALMKFSSVAVLGIASFFSSRRWHLKFKTPLSPQLILYPLLINKKTS